jgi:hypothetical protein
LYLYSLLISAVGPDSPAGSTLIIMASSTVDRTLDTLAEHDEGYLPRDLEALYMEFDSHWIQPSRGGLDATIRGVNRRRSC